RAFCTSSRLKNFCVNSSNTCRPSATSSFGMQKRSKEKFMYRNKINRFFQSLVLIALVTFAVTPAFAFDNSNGPVLPEECSSIRVQEGNKLAFHAYAKGVQIYKWNLL